MGQLALPTSGLVYLDASPIIYSVEKKFRLIKKSCSLYG